MWLYAPRSQSMQSFLLTLGSTEGGKVKAIDDTHQHIEKPLPVPVLEHDGVPGVPADDDVVQRPGNFRRNIRGMLPNPTQRHAHCKI